MAAALEVARDCTPDDLVVVLIPDSGRGYLSKVFDDDWMASYGFISSQGVTVDDVLASRSAAVLLHCSTSNPRRRGVMPSR